MQTVQKITPKLLADDPIAATMAGGRGCPVVAGHEGTDFVSHETRLGCCFALAPKRAQSLREVSFSLFALLTTIACVQPSPIALAMSDENRPAAHRSFKIAT